MNRRKKPFNKTYLPYVIILLVFMLSHVVFYLLSGGFDYQTFHFWQILDLELLRNRLFESVWYLHSQPPLFNMFIGLVEKGAAGFSHVVYHVIYVLLGLMASFGMYHLQRRMNIPAFIALPVTCAVLISPSWILYEHWLMYTFPVMVLLTFSPIMLYRFLVTRSVWDGFLFFFLMMLLVLLRGIFHPVWFLLVLLLLVPYFKQNTSVLFRAAIIPLSLVMLFMVKNAVLFNQWSGSSWLGPNLYKMTTGFSPKKTDELFCQNKISSVYKTKPFSPLSSYSDFCKSYEPTGIPALDQENKRDGDPNFNHHFYLTINEEYLRTSLVLIAYNPDIYVKHVWRNWKRFCLPAWNYGFFENQDKSIQSVLMYLNYLFLDVEGDHFIEITRELHDHPEFTFLSFLWLVIFWGGICLAFSAGLNSIFTQPEKMTLAFCALTTLLVLFAGIFILPVENFRIRFVLTPYAALFGGMIFHRGRAFIYRGR